MHFVIRYECGEVELARQARIDNGSAVCGEKGSPIILWACDRHRDISEDVTWGECSQLGASFSVQQVSEVVKMILLTWICMSDMKLVEARLGK